MAAAVPTWGDRLGRRGRRWLTLLPRHLAHLCSHLSSTPTHSHSHTHSLPHAHFHLLPGLFLWGGNPNGSAAREAHISRAAASNSVNFSSSLPEEPPPFHTSKREWVSEWVRERFMCDQLELFTHVSLSECCGSCEDGAKPARLRRSCIVPRRR